LLNCSGTVNPLPRHLDLPTQAVHESENTCNPSLAPKVHICRSKGFDGSPEVISTKYARIREVHLLPSVRSSRLGLGITAVLTALMIYAIAGVRSPATSLLLSDLLQMGIVLWATFCSFQAALASKEHLQRLWMLFTTALFVCGVAQALGTYYQNFAHASASAPWPSDILFILWVLPVFMMLLPGPEKGLPSIDWQRVLDLAQLAVVALTAYLYFFYISSRWEAEGPRMVVKIIRLQMFRDVALAVAFFACRGAISGRSVRALFGRVATVFLLASASDLAFLLTPNVTSIGGKWTDLAWCAPFLFAAVMASTWHAEEEPAREQEKSPLPTIVASQVLPILIPLLVLFMGRRIVAEQVAVAWTAVAVSFVLSAARLLLTNSKQRRIAEALSRTEQALRRSERMFVTAFRSSHDAVGISSIPSGEFLEVNDGFTRLTGYTHAEALGRTPVEMNLWVDASHRTRLMAKLREEGEVREEEFQCRTKSGETRICLFSGTLIQLDEGPCALVIVRDITARKKAEEALRSSEERFRNLVQDLQVGVVLLGPDAETKFANRAALATFGLTEEEALGKKSSGFKMTAIREDGVEIPLSLRPGPRVIATKRPVHNEVVGWRRTDSNEVFWTLVDAVPHLTPEGNVASAILSISDITERKQAEEALRASEERFRTLIREMDVGVVLTGPDEKIQFANEAAQKIFEIPLEEVRGRTTEELNLISFREDGTEVPYPMRPAQRVIRTGQTKKDEVLGWRRVGSGKVIWTLGNAAPLWSKEGTITGVIAVFTDITERQRTEAALHQLSTRLLQLQDEERRRLGRELHDSLAQSVLAVNLNLAQAAQSTDHFSQKTRHALDEARRLLQEMSQEIRTLSYLLHPPLLDELGLASAIKEYAEGFSQRSEIHVQLNLPAGFGRLSQDTETALFRIVQESLANVQRHSGSLAATITLGADAGRLTLEVSDQGRGIGQGSINAAGGSRARLGVGILGMRERMTQLGGKLEIESSPSGTTVRATIPVIAEVSDAGSHSRRG
jgi:PAS domain S-box-containing protein